MEFENKVCVITGGSNGIGRCLVETFLERGASVAFIDVDEEGGRLLCEKYSADKLFFHCGDIAEEKVLVSFANEIKARFSKVDFLINNACISKKGILSGCSYEDFNYILRLGVTAPYMLTSLLLPIFSGGGSIVNISSTRAFMSQPDTESYSAAKGGISSLTHALSISLSGKIRVNSISPGWIDTSRFHHDAVGMETVPADLSQHPAGRIGVPKDIASVVLFLCSDDASFITGQNITVDGGMTKQMIYHNDYDWQYNPKNGGE